MEGKSCSIYIYICVCVCVCVYKVWSIPFYLGKWEPFITHPPLPVSLQRTPLQSIQECHLLGWRDTKPPYPCKALSIYNISGCSLSCGIPYVSFVICLLKLTVKGLVSVFLKIERQKGKKDEKHYSNVYLVLLFIVLLNVVNAIVPPP